MPKKKTAETKQKTKQVAFRLPTDLLERVDRHAARMGQETPGLTFTRVDAVKALLTRALDESNEPKR